MGMSASQARYLSLTARKSDLEFRGQQITQSRLMLSNQSANLYSSMLSMSVPTPPVETDFMKDVYSFSMNGDNTTLSSYKLSMGKDGYGYDILYSKPASTQQLTASTTSEVQKSVTRKASQGSSTNSYPIKIKTSYDDSTPQSKTPNVSRLVQINSGAKKYFSITPSNSTNKFRAKENDVILNGSSFYCSIYNQLHGKKVTDATKPSKNNTMSSSSVNKMTKNGSDITYNYGTSETRTLKNLTNEDIAKIFGGTTQNNTFNYTNSLLSNILAGFGDSSGNVTVGTDTGNSVDSGGTAGKGNVSFYIDAENMKFYVLKCNDGTTSGIATGSSVFDNNKIDTNKANMYEYDLAALLGLSVATGVEVDTSGDGKAEDKTVYYNDYGTGSDAVRNYYTFGWDDTIGLYFQTTTELDNDGWKIDDNALVSINPEDFGITKNNDVDGGSTTSDKEYQYFRDSSTGDIWELCTTTSTSGTISESWKLFEPNKTATINDKEAQFIDETDWPTGISHTQQNGEYDCYYVPDETGTGGSYYLIAKDKFSYDNSNDITVSNGGVTQYEANNTYKIEGMTACVVNEDNVQ